MGTEVPSWDAVVAISGCPIQSWSGDVWRCHRRKYAGNDASGSIRTTGRFNRGSDKFDPDSAWPVLYTGLAPHVALGERLRHTTPETLRLLSDQRLSKLGVVLHAVLNLCAGSGCAEIGVAGLDIEDLCRPLDYEKSHQIALVARSFAEALLVPSCTRFPEGNLIVFPDRLRAESSIIVSETLDPDLFVDWSTI